MARTVVQGCLVHATIAMTLDTDSAYTPSMGCDAADKLDAVPAPAPTKRTPRKLHPQRTKPRQTATAGDCSPAVSLALPRFSAVRLARLELATFWSATKRSIL